VLKKEKTKPGTKEAGYEKPGLDKKGSSRILFKDKPWIK